MAKFAITRRDRSTVNGERYDRRVYVVDIAYLSGQGAWSSTTDPAKATTWRTREEAEHELACEHWWNEARVEEV